MKMGLTILAALALCAGLVFTAEREPEYELTAVEVRDIAEEIEIVRSCAPGRAAGARCGASKVRCS